MQAPTYLIRPSWTDHTGPSKLFWAFLATFIELVLWLLFLIMLVIVLPFYIIIAPIYFLCVKKDCKCRKFVVTYFRVCFFAATIALILLGSGNRPSGGY